MKKSSVMDALQPAAGEDKELQQLSKRSVMIQKQTLIDLL
jgi:hypothetical protein